MKKSIEIVLEWQASGYIYEFVEFLNRRGVVADFEVLSLTRVFVDQWDLECEKIIRNHGYGGGEVRKFSKFFEQKGTIDALFDSDRLSHEKVESLASDWYFTGSA